MRLGPGPAHEHCSKIEHCRRIVETKRLCTFVQSRRWIVCSARTIKLILSWSNTKKMELDCSMILSGKVVKWSTALQHGASNKLLAVNAWCTSKLFESDKENQTPKSNSEVLMLIVHKALNGKAPLYISELLQVYTPSRNLRSSSMLLLIEPKSQHSWGDRSFSSAAPRIWNSLPLNFRTCLCTTTFKSLLKTYLMSQVFKD